MPSTNGATSALGSRGRGMITQRRKRFAFTLIELLVAVVCLASASSGVLAALKYGSDKTIGARQRALAMQNACSTMDSAKSDAFNSLLVAGTTVTTPTITGIPGTVTVTKTITQQGATALYNASVTVQWTYESQSSIVTLETVLWEGGTVT